MPDAIPWDGINRSYIPPDHLTIDSSLELHDDAVADVDPITHSVLRHALWNVNTEHGNLLMRISGSAIAAYAHDFNTAILDENGDFVFFGPYMQFLVSPIGHSVKWTLEQRSENPGIGPGDVFLFNDPWIGGSHQNDVGVIAPVFVDDKLFCWVG
jgi:N-methylhydantoinase B